MSEDGRKGLEFREQREKHRYPFGHLTGQSSWSCKVIFASLRNRGRRARQELQVLLFIYTLFHLPACIMEKKNRQEAIPFLRTLPLQRALFALCLPLISPGPRSQLPHCPFPSVTTLISLPSIYQFAQLCSGLRRPCLLGHVPLSSSVFSLTRSLKGSSSRLLILEEFILFFTVRVAWETLFHW